MAISPYRLTNSWSPARSRRSLFAMEFCSMRFLRTLIAGAPERNRPRSPLMRPTLFFGALRTLVICLAAWAFYAHERNWLIGENENNSVALALVLERNVSHVV